MKSRTEIAEGEWQGAAKVVLQAAPEGVYMYVYKTASSSYAEEDHLQDTFDICKEICTERFQIPADAWVDTKEYEQ
ncbi:hypothetical protein [Parvularcula oceani]|uniref:hypothetical protein n=1 Tax=Parvularcula oceani TaxID=1247963 RepID=UPI0004E1C214|nr:hypothetical protein [Parvularcula oceani]